MALRKHVVAIGLAALGLAGPAYGAAIFAKVGTFDGQFLKMDVGARAEGMGGAFVGVADDATALYWNAAGIARIDPEKSEFSFNQAVWPADIQFTQAGYVFHVKRFPGAFGFSVRALYMAPMIETTAYQPYGTGHTFDAGYMTAGFTYARSFTDKFSAGGTIHFIHEGLAEFSQQSYAVDVGTLYDVGAMGMRIGMAIQNVGSSVTFIQKEGRIPGVFRVGTSLNLIQRGDQKLLGSFEFSHPPDNAERMNVGAEYSFQKFAFLRGGYNLNYDAEGLAAGAGFHIPVSVAGQADVDYSYTDMKDLGGAHRFSIRFLF
jgi:hypothetical protein